MESDIKTRYNFIVAILLLALSLFFVRLFYLQILKGGVYKLRSETQAIKAQIIYPFRGNFYDRNGNLIVYNAPSYSLQLFLGSFRKDRIGLLAHLLEMDSSEVFNLILNSEKYYRYGDIKILRDLDLETVQKIEENIEYLPGVEIVSESKRVYNLPAKMSHIIGYIQEINKEELEVEQYYSIGDLVGKTGLERTYENELRGQKGKKFVGLLAQGLKTTKFNEGRADQPVKNGDDLYLTIDSKLQIKAEEMLEGKRGAIVAIDPNNGEILALVSKPDFDVSQLSGKNFSLYYNQLIEDKEKPLLNRAIQSSYPPGSTWKPLMALAALEEGVINENTTLYCPGSFQYGNRVYGCHGGHGMINVRRAIQVSCNVFFYQVALKLQLERLGKWGRAFGFGQTTGIDIPYEKAGIMPTIEWLEKRYGKNGYPKGAIVNYGIGQGEISVTPLQLACYVATIANGGIYYRPHLVRAIKNSLLNQLSFLEVDHRNLNLNPKIVEIVKNGMFDVVNVPGGTAFGIRINNLDICGKTGTAQNPGGQDHSWFICFAPKDSPRIAMAVLVENAGFGAAVAAPIAGELLKTFFNVQELTIPIDSTKFFGD
jgi:penicillin-binding protein 2